MNDEHHVAVAAQLLADVANDAGGRREHVRSTLAIDVDREVIATFAGAVAATEPAVLDGPGQRAVAVRAAVRFRGPLGRDHTGQQGRRRAAIPETEAHRTLLRDQRAQLRAAGRIARGRERLVADPVLGPRVEAE
jgi:hypothetical protein